VHKYSIILVNTTKGSAPNYTMIANYVNAEYDKPGKIAGFEPIPSTSSLAVNVLVQSSTTLFEWSIRIHRITKSSTGLQ
jgi:hypothetical protein